MMALSALKKFTAQFLGGSQHSQRGNECGNECGQPSGEQGGERCGFQGGNNSGKPSAEGAEAYVVGDRLVLCPMGQVPAPSAFDHAAELLAWLRREYPAPRKKLCEQLWVAAQDLEHAHYPKFLAATEWP